MQEADSMSMYSLFTKKHFEWLVCMIVEIDVPPDKVDIIIEKLTKTNKNFKPAKFRKAITIYRNQSAGGI